MNAIPENLPPAHPSDLRRIAFVGNYLPRKCGIATFTHDVRAAIAGAAPQADCIVVPVNDLAEGYDYSNEVRFELDEQDLDSYRRAADFLNIRGVEVVSLQHEYGIFGGPDGSHVLTLLRELKMPFVTTLHTVLKDPSVGQRRVLWEIGELAARMVVMSEKSKGFLMNIYGVPEEKIDLIPHGIPDMPFVDPNFYKDKFKVEGKNVLLTFGLLSPNKGIENAINAMPQIVKQFPNAIYIILGATHPALIRQHGEKYRESLQALVKELKMDDHVMFCNEFVELNELMEYIGAADIYITPYLNEAQAVSGTLAYSFGCGKAVVSTPYWHASELLAEDRGALVPFGDSGAIAKEVIGLLQDETRRHAMRKKAYLLGREMVWSKVGQMYVDSLEKARHGRAQRTKKSHPPRFNGSSKMKLPKLRLDHLWRMTDSTGLIQHARYTIPHFPEGYCTDDNARALLLMVMLEDLGVTSHQSRKVTTNYAAFLNHAYDPEFKRFRNFLNYDRTWAEDAPLTDALGRSLWALGACVGRSRRKSLQWWAAALFEVTLRNVEASTSPRDWAQALLGIHEYLRRFRGDRLVERCRDTLVDRLVGLFPERLNADWHWFEPVCSYDNARIPHALIVSGQTSGNERASELGLNTLRWLCDKQRAPNGHFRAIGCNGFFPCGADPAQFDQQPLEAQGMVSATLAAYQATDDPTWLNEARSAFEWFLGRNDLGLALYDPISGGCRDGLREDGVNENQGAESTLAFLHSLVELMLWEDSQPPFHSAPVRTLEHAPA